VAAVAGEEGKAVYASVKELLEAAALPQVAREQPAGQAAADGFRTRTRPVPTSRHGPVLRTSRLDLLF